MRKIAACLVVLSFGTLPAQAASGNQLDIELRASVPEVCNIGSISASALAQSTTLNVSASCNAPRFEINLDSAKSLQILRASSLGGVGQVLALDNQIVITPSQPGSYMIEIELGHSIAELDDLDISIATS